LDISSTAANRGPVSKMEKLSAELPPQDYGNEIHDVIIVGAGPSGCVCAYFLAKAGLDVLLIEKSSFPREKMCAGGVPGSVLDILPIDDFKQCAIPIEKYSFTYRGKKKAIGAIAPGGIYSIERGVFDYRLAKCAVNAGARLVENFRIVNARGIGGKITVKGSDGGKFSGKILVGADGGHSLISQKFNFNHIGKGSRDMGICGYYKFYPDERTLKHFRNTVHLDFNFIKGGVAGILPKKDYLWIGVFKGERGTLGPLEKASDGFIEMLGLIGKKDRFGGLLIPLYRGKRRLTKDNVILIGESAALVNPLSGEGIKPCMESGEIAAGEIIKFFREGKPLDSYSDRIHREIGEELLRAAGFAKVAYTCPGSAYEGMIRVADDAVKIMNGDLSYGDFLERLKKKIFRKIGIKI